MNYTDLADPRAGDICQSLVFPEISTKSVWDPAGTDLSSEPASVTRYCHPHEAFHEPAQNILDNFTKIIFFLQKYRQTCCIMLHLFTELKENPESLKTANSTAVVKKFLIDLCLVAGRGILKCKNANNDGNKSNVRSCNL